MTQDVPWDGLRALLRDWQGGSCVLVVSGDLAFVPEIRFGDLLILEDTDDRLVFRLLPAPEAVHLDRSATSAVVTSGPTPTVSALVDRIRISLRAR